MESIFTSLYLATFILSDKIPLIATKKLSIYLFELHTFASSLVFAIPIQHFTKLYYSPVFIVFILYPILSATFRLNVLKHYIFIFIHILAFQQYDFFMEFFSLKYFTPAEGQLMIIFVNLYVFVITSVLVVWIVNNRKRAIEQEKKQTILFKELNESKAKLFAIISHDLMSPTATILSMSELITNKIKSPERCEQYADLIHKTATNQHDLLNNLLTWAKSQLNKSAVKKEPLNIKEIILDICKTFEEWVSIKEISLITDIKINNQVYADENHIRTIIRNILTNAIKFTPKGKLIEISAKEDTNFVFVSIKDSGIGMDNSTLESLFKSDTKNTSLGTEGEKGTGLGLKLCKEFVALNAGMIWAESTPGKGTAIYFTIPKYKETLPENSLQAPLYSN